MAHLSYIDIWNCFICVPQTFNHKIITMTKRIILLLQERKNDAMIRPAQGFFVTILWYKIFGNFFPKKLAKLAEFSHYKKFKHIFSKIIPIFFL
jgi:hypothetical protein